jgi:hypothetical protein
MIKEHDRVVLQTDLPDDGLERGDVGTIVNVYGHGDAYDVEFITLVGETITVTTLLADQVRPVRKREITHARLVGKR